MIIVLGYRTPSAQEVPALLYLGDDGVEANRICETDPHPRIARLDQPVPRPVKHWIEEAAAAFARTSNPINAPVLPPPAAGPELSKPEEVPSSPPPPEATPAAAQAAGDEPAGPVFDGPRTRRR